VIIPERFNGPPGSGNGGYSAGLIGAELGGERPLQVTLRLPPPLDRALALSRHGAGIAVHEPDGALVAEAVPVDPFDAVVPPVPYDVAVEVSASYPGFTDHPFPTCYVCGPRRDDGLRLFPGTLPDGRTAAPFVPPPETGTETVWAALDCPGGWSIIGPGRPYVLGRMATVIRAVPPVGTRCVVVGAAVSREGRKALVHSTLYGPEGELLAYARATWIAI
jgi:hypothetical protein